MVQNVPALIGWPPQTSIPHRASEVPMNKTRVGTGWAVANRVSSSGRIEFRGRSSQVTRLVIKRAERTGFSRCGRWLQTILHSPSKPFRLSRSQTSFRLLASIHKVGHTKSPGTSRGGARTGQKGPNHGVRLELNQRKRQFLPACWKRAPLATVHQRRR